MTLHPNFIGCDIGKSSIDLWNPQGAKHARAANEAASLQAWAGSLCPATSFVVLEATGHHDRLVRYALSGAGIPFARVNPLQARRFAQARGRLAKTDRIDARTLSEMGSLLRPAPSPAPDPARERLQALARRRDQLVEARAREMRHKSESFDAHVAADLELAIAQLDARIQTLEEAIAQHIRAAGDLADQAERLRSAPGVGPVTALTLLAHMPELGRLSPKAAAALAGLAPINNDSGQKRGPSPVKGGRPRLRRALYMAALSAIRACSRFNAFFQTLASRSGSKKLAIIATARKLLTALNAMQRDQTPFR